MTTARPRITSKQRQVLIFADRQRPNSIIADSPEECYRKAWALSGLEISAGEFTDILYLLNIKPENIAPVRLGTSRDRTPQFALRFPYLESVGGDGEYGTIEVK